MARRTRTIIDRISERTKPKQFKRIIDFETAYNHNAAVLKDSTVNFDERLKVLDSLAAQLTDATNELHEIKGRYEAVSGHMAEGGEVLMAIVNQLAQDATLTTNLIEVYFKSDPQILMQVVEVMDAEIRREAWKKLDPALRAMITAELEQVR